MLRQPLVMQRCYGVAGVKCQKIFPCGSLEQGGVECPSMFSLQRLYNHSGEILSASGEVLISMADRGEGEDCCYSNYIPHADNQ